MRERDPQQAKRKRERERESDGSPDLRCLLHTPGRSAPFHIEGCCRGSTSPPPSPHVFCLYPLYHSTVALCWAGARLSGVSFKIDEGCAFFWGLFFFWYVYFCRCVVFLAFAFVFSFAPHLPGEGCQILSQLSPPAHCQKECQNKWQSECQKTCQIESKIVCQIECWELLGYAIIYAGQNAEMNARIYARYMQKYIQSDRSQRSRGKLLEKPTFLEIQRKAFEMKGFCCLQEVSIYMSHGQNMRRPLQ